MIDWIKAFKDAEADGSIAIQNVKPPHETARNIFQDDEGEILRAAAELGWRRIVIVDSSTGKSLKPKIESFVKLK